MPEEISCIGNPQKERREKFNSSSVGYKLYRPHGQLYPIWFMLISRQGTKATHWNEPDDFA